MTSLLEFLAEQPLIVLFLLLGLGAGLGSVRLGSVQVGPAAVLFTAIALGALAAHQGQPLQIPPIAGSLGLVLFTYCVGIQNGPDFFARIRSALGIMLAAAGVLVLGGVVAALLGSWLGLSRTAIAGTFAGATTNTPALAAAIESSGDAAEPTVGYAVAYIFGVIGILGACALAQRSRRADADDAAPLAATTVCVTQAGTTIADLSALTGGRVAFSRIKHTADGSVHVAKAQDVVEEGDLLTIIGHADSLGQVTAQLGRPATEQLQSDQRILAVRRITLSASALEGQPLRALALPERFDAVVTRVRRGDVDMVASSGLVLAPGDRLRVVAPRANIGAISRFLGDSSRAMADVNPIALGLGMVLGILVGLVPIPGIGAGFQIGAAAGTLVVGLIFGKLGRVGPLVVSMSHSASSTLSQFGLLVFLAWAGIQAGGQILTALTDDLGVRIAGLGVVITVVVCSVTLLLVRLAPGVGPARQAGILAGLQTQPAALAFVAERTGHDVRVGLGYATVYPAAMIAKILVAHALVLW